jgi:hypothetical protein
MNNQFWVDKNPGRSGISASDGSADSLDPLSPANLASIVDIELLIFPLTPPPFVSQPRVSG